MLRDILDRRSVVLFSGILIIFLLIPLIIPRFYTYIAALIFLTSLLALSLNIVLGYGGLYQFHHAVFFGIGAYTIALIMTKTLLPGWVGFVAGPIAAAIVGMLIGWLCLRLSKLHFGMLQISLGSLLWAIVFRWYDFTGGDDGIHDIPIPHILSSVTHSYYFILTIVVISVIILYIVIKSPFGHTLIAIRENPQRCEAIGINVKQHQLKAFVIASFFAGVAGVLFVVLERSVFPDLLFWILSIELCIMCLLGGWFTFIGPILGATITVLLRTFVGIYTDYWTLILGSILILLIFFLPEGIIGFFQERFKTGSKMPCRKVDENDAAS